MEGSINGRTLKGFRTSGVNELRRLRGILHVRLDHAATSRFGHVTAKDNEYSLRLSVLILAFIAVLGLQRSLPLGRCFEATFPHEYIKMTASFEPRAIKKLASSDRKCLRPRSVSQESVINVYNALPPLFYLRGELLLLLTESLNKFQKKVSALVYITS